MIHAIMPALLLSHGMWGLVQVVPPPPVVLKKDNPEVKVDPEIAALAKKLKDIDPKTRLKAIEDLAKKGEKAAPVADKICDATMDSNVQVRLAALASLEKIRPDLYKPLIELLFDKNNFIRDRAITKLSEMGKDASPVVNILATQMISAFSFSKYGSISYQSPITGSTGHYEAFLRGKMLLSAINNIQNDHASIKPTLLLLARPTNLDVDFRFKCLDALITDAAGDPLKEKKLMLPVTDGIQQDPRRISEYVIRLGKFGKLAESQLPVLKKLKLSPDSAACDAASKAVEQIEADK